MKMYLGTNFFYPDSRSVYIYEVDNHADVCTICALNVLTGEVEKVDDKFLPSQRHHHSSYLDTIRNKFYIFGGFGSRKYTNTLEVYDLDQKSWNTIKLKGDFVAPRFFSSMGALNANELLLFGGTGNSSGDQSIGKIYYYDLYKINLKDSTVQKVRDFSYDGAQIVPVRNLLLSDDGASFYTLCYPMQEASSHLQLYKFSLQNDSYEVLGNSIPMESKAILSNANLYYNKETKEFVINLTTKDIVKATDYCGVRSGRDVDKFKEMVNSQGGDTSFIEDESKFKFDKCKFEIKAENDGYITKINAEKIGETCVLLGAGRNVKTDAIDSLAGIMLSVKINDYICKNDTVMTLYSNDENKLKEAVKLANASFIIGNEKAEEKNIILKQF
jgi:hypothetical protein